MRLAFLKVSTVTTVCNYTGAILTKLCTSRYCTRVWAWVTEYMQVSMFVNTMLCFNKRYLPIFNHPRLYPSISKEYSKA